MLSGRIGAHRSEESKELTGDNAQALCFMLARKRSFSSSLSTYTRHTDNFHWMDLVQKGRHRDEDEVGAEKSRRERERAG